jgi:polysaccharide export outer membrane protein
MEAKNPGQNIVVLSNDVITVPKADMVYVVGAVHRSGGFPLLEKEQISVLQAVSLAEGLDKVASGKTARILRQSSPGAERTEVMVNVEKILAGRAQDVALQANDILFIPNSLAKSTGVRVLEAALQAGTGVAVFGR